MPIRGLTENPRIPRLGKIRTGKMVAGRNGGAEHPQNTAYFVCPPEVQAIYGEEPTELPIWFLTSDREHIANQYYRAYNKTNGLICQGDGFRANALLDADQVQRVDGDLSRLSRALWSTGQTKKFYRADMDCPGSGYDGHDACPMYQSKDCRPIMTLNFCIEGVPGLGEYSLSTSSINSIRNINGTIELITGAAGGIAGVPLRLVRTQTPAKVDNKQTNVWVVDLKCDLPLSELLKQVQSGRSTPQALLSPPDDLDGPDDEPEADRPVAAGPEAIDAVATVVEDAAAAIEPTQLHAITASIPELRKLLPPGVMTDFLYTLAHDFSGGKSFKPNALTAAQAAEVLNRIRAIAAEYTETPPQEPGEPQQPSLDAAAASPHGEADQPAASATEEEGESK